MFKPPVVNLTSFKRKEFENNASEILTYPACWHASHSFSLVRNEVDLSGVESKLLPLFLCVSAPLSWDVRVNLFLSFFRLSSLTNFGCLDIGGFSVMFIQFMSLLMLSRWMMAEFAFLDFSVANL